MAPARAPRSTKPRGSVVQTVLACTATGALCFYAGSLWGMNAGCAAHCGSRRVDGGSLGETLGEIWNTAFSSTESRFPPAVSRIAVGATLVSRDDFTKTFDVGVPYDQSGQGNQAVLILHNTVKALPSNSTVAQQAKSTNVSVPALSSAAEATENCDFLNVILTQADGRRAQCVALMGQYESFHIQKFMRLPPESAGQGPVNRNNPLRLVNRGAQANGRKSTKPPSQEQTREYWKMLGSYLSALDEALETLKPIASRVAETHRNTVVVMVCNMGQSELLMNFACNARAKELDLSSVLVFATDYETKGLAEGLGLSVFYDESIFGSMPKGAARRYADKNFMGMMMAKVYCVQMTLMLGHDVLFQDVDVVWYRDPLEYFHDRSKSRDFDLYAQDDGNHALYYAPYSANTGFYYVRNDGESGPRTQYFFNSLLVSGDLILSTRSHQISLIAILNEHASMYGLKVKILSRDETDFPGGYHYHRRAGFMRELLKGEQSSYMFHMSWTLNKDNKIKFFQQMGEFHLKDQCVGKPAPRILGSRQEEIARGSLVQPCCSAEPLITCHYRDKPSKTSCKDSPSLDKNRPSFW